MLGICRIRRAAWPCPRREPLGWMPRVLDVRSRRRLSRPRRISVRLDRPIGGKRDLRDVAHEIHARDLRRRLLDRTLPDTKSMKPCATVTQTGPGWKGSHSIDDVKSALSRLTRTSSSLIACRAKVRSRRDLDPTQVTCVDSGTPAPSSDPRQREDRTLFGREFHGGGRSSSRAILLDAHGRRARQNNFGRRPRPG